MISSRSTGDPRQTTVVEAISAVNGVPVDAVTFSSVFQAALAPGSYDNKQGVNITLQKRVVVDMQRPASNRYAPNVPNELVKKPTKPTTRATTKKRQCRVSHHLSRDAVVQVDWEGRRWKGRYIGPVPPNQKRQYSEDDDELHFVCFDDGQKLPVKRSALHALYDV